MAATARRIRTQAGTNDTTTGFSAEGQPKAPLNFEFWHNANPYDPHVGLDAWQKRRAAGKALRAKTLLPKVAQTDADGAWRFNPDPPVLTSVDADTAAKEAHALTEYGDTLVRERRSMLKQYRLADVTHRVVMGQRLLQASTDFMLGWAKIDGRDYYVRQMKNMKWSIPVEWLSGQAFDFYAFACGAILARGHARTGDIAKIAGYCGSSAALDNALADFAEAYANQNARDHKALVKAIADGRVAASSQI